MGPTADTTRRAYGAVLAATFGILLVSGALLRVGSLRPRNLLGAATYDCVFTTHGVAVLASLPVVLVCLAPAVKPDLGIRAGIATIFLIGAALSGVGKAWLLVMLGGGGLFTWYLLRPILRSPVGAVLLVATMTTAGGWVGVLAGHPASMGMALVPVVLAVLVLPILALPAATRVGGTAFLGSVVVYAVCWAMGRFWLPGSPLAIPEWIAGLVVAVVVFRCARQAETPWLSWVRRAQALLFVEGMTLTVLIRIADETPLNDTLFAVAAVHFEAFVLIFALLGELRHAATRSGWTGLLLATLGSQVFGWGCAVVGSRGMPRRYSSYLETFSALQKAVSFGALLFLAGVVGIVVTHLVVGARDHSGRSTAAESA